MDNLLFRNVTLVERGHPQNGNLVDLWVKNGLIHEIAKGGSLKAEKDLPEKEGGCISVGWVDFGVHLSDPGMEWKDDLKTLSASGLAGGYTTLVTYPNTRPVLDNREYIASVRSRSAHLPVDFLPLGALTLGNEGRDMAELFDMQQAGAVGFSDGKNPIESSGVLLRALQYASAFDGLILDLPLDMSISGDSMVNEGTVSMQMGMKGSPALAETLRTRRDLGLLDYFSGRLHLGPLTTAESVDAVRKARKNHPGLTTGTTLTHLVETDEAVHDFDNNFKIWPPLRNKSDQKGLRKALQDGTLDLISSGHHPQGTEEKNVDFVLAKYGMLGLESCFGQAHTTLVLGKVIELDHLIACLAGNPRRILKLATQSMQVGAVAELTWFDPGKEWTFSAKDIKSKSKNTSWTGRKYTGKALGIYSKGKFTPSE
ncbi:MAG: hypothetical protein H6581_29365 [Bacteroidia bacterium]|nr:hypothetical protein [Bacteroidia bacterium]